MVPVLQLQHHKSILSSTSKWWRQVRFIFSTVTSSYSKGTNSLAPILVYFCALPETSALSRWTIIHSSSRIRTPEFFFLSRFFHRHLCFEILPGIALRHIGKTSVYQTSRKALWDTVIALGQYNFYFKIILDFVSF